VSIAGLTHIEERLWCLVAETGDVTYDFRYEDSFACRHPWRLEGPLRAVSRLGATPDYPQRYHELRAKGIELVHTPETYRRTTELPVWYPSLKGLTPRSMWFDEPPTVDEVGSHFEWPVFIKGERQTNCHRRRLSIMEDPDDYRRLLKIWNQDSILAWQRIVVRQFVPLRRVDQIDIPTQMPRSFEFRTFWWKKHCVGVGAYWTSSSYRANRQELADLMAVAEQAADRIDATFLVVDVAQAATSEWIVIELNDGQDAGYGAVPRRTMWQKVLDIESE